MEYQETMNVYVETFSEKKWRTMTVEVKDVVTRLMSIALIS